MKDLVETNTFWDLKTKSVKVRALASGSWQVIIDISAKKSKVDRVGNETELPMNDPIQIGLFGHDHRGNQTTLYLKQHRIRSGTNQIAIKISHKPDEAAIDPHNLLVDTDMRDNRLALGREKSYATSNN